MFNGIVKNTGSINKIYKKKNNFILEIFSEMHFSKEGCDLFAELLARHIQQSYNLYIDSKEGVK